MARRTTLVLSGLLAVSAGFAWQGWASKTRSCPSYIPSTGELVAHAGGGLPDRTYANDREAMDLAASHGFHLIELDFMVRDGRLTIGHDGMPESSLSVADLMEWLDAHPHVSIITDFKTDNVHGLAMLKQASGTRQGRFIPQIYHPAEHDPVVAMGYPAPILTVYRLGDEGWQSAANALPLRAVTMPVERKYLADQTHHPVFLHTVNEPMEGYGLYTDCLIPKGSGTA